MHAWINGLLGVAALGAGIWAVGRFLPGVIIKKVHRAFAAAKACPWFRDAAHPKRAKWLLATAELLEDEIPEPGTGAALYAALGAKVAGLTPLLAGTGGKWAAALEKCGDAVDLELDGEIKELATPTVGTPAGMVVPPAPPAA